MYVYELYQVQKYTGILDFINDRGPNIYFSYSTVLIATTTIPQVDFIDVLQWTSVVTCFH